MTDESLFTEALAIRDADARREFLVNACAGDDSLRARVETLLGAYGASNALDRSPVDLARTGAYSPLASVPGSLRVGDLVGPYKLLERIGEGGMGEVWVADQQEPLKRRVALKLIKPGMDSRSVLGRFEAERQALAVMDHPNIARVLDAGTTTDGRPFFVMELVKGTPITEFCDARKLTPKQRLELFIPVCHAIQHAHMKGIIHRDIKPSNVLVALHDEAAVPKVIDFGVAKAIGQQLTEKTIYTGFGALVGTPAYMAPEQASFNQLDVDTRADVYALGVLLYELLAGSTPVEADRLKKAALDEVLRIVRDEEPQRPSQRLSTSETKASIAAVRGTEPAKLSALMKGEIDWIVMKALEKDRTRRYDTANGLAKDIQRYLSGDSVEACPPTFSYRLLKVINRNKTAFVTTVAVMAFTLTTLMLSLRAEDQARVAEAIAGQQRDDAIRSEAKAIAAEKAAAAERDDKRAALRQAQGLGLTLRSELMRQANPGLALILAVEGAKRDPGLLANNTLTAALDACHEQRTLVGHEGPVQACSFSPDGLRVVSGGADKTARVWDASTGKELFVLRDHGKPVIHASYSPDGQRIITIAADRTGHGMGTESGRIEPVSARLWEASTGRLIASWQDPPAPKMKNQHFRLVAHDVAFSPDGRRVATTFAVYPNGVPQVRDTATGNFLFALDGHDEPVTSVAYSSNGKFIATASTDKTAIIRDADTGKPVHIVKHPFGIGSVAFSPDSKKLLTIGNGVGLSHNKTPEGDTVSGSSHSREEIAGRVWDAETGKEIAALKWPDGGKTICHSGSFSRDGKRIVTTGQHYRDQFGPLGFPWIWDAATGEPLVKEIGRDPERAMGELAVFSPDGAGRWLLTVTDRTAYLRDASTGKARAVYRGHEDAIQAAGFSPDGKRAVTAAKDGTVRIWNAEQGPESAARLGRWPGCDDAAIGPDGRSLLELPSGRLWDVDAGRLIATLPVEKGNVWLAAYAPDGSNLLTVSSDHKVRLWNPRTGESLPSLEGHSEQIISAVFDGNGKKIATASRDGTARLWDAATGKELARLEKTERTKTGGSLNNIEQFIGEVSFSADGRRIVGTPNASAMWAAAVWDAETGKELQVLRFRDGWTGNNRYARFLPDGRVLTQQPAGVWNADGTAVEAPLRASDQASDLLMLSRDGRLAASCSPYDRKVGLFEAKTGRLVHMLTGPCDGVISLAFSRGGDHLACGSKDGTSHVWHTATGREILSMPHAGITSVGFTPDGKQVMTAGRFVRLWPIDPLTAADTRRPRDLTAAERKLVGLEP